MIRITVEGPRGCGASTVAQLITRLLRECGQDVKPQLYYHASKMAYEDWEDNAAQSIPCLMQRLSDVRKIEVMDNPTCVG